MAQRGPRWIAAAAIASIAFTAAAAHADSELAQSRLEFLAPYNPVLFPRFFAPPTDQAGRPYKFTTVFQLDGEILDGEADFLFRLQAKRKKIVYLKVRF